MYYMIFARWKHSQISAGSKREHGDKKYSAALDFATFWWWVAYVHMLLYVCDYVCAYVREKVMFEVYGSESESMSDQYGFCFCFQPFIKHIAFRRMTASMLAFLVVYVCKILNTDIIGSFYIEDYSLAQFIP